MKNAIAVIDQELIDWFENWLSDTEVNELLEIDEKTIELLDMTKDLIEINAELTKREQLQISIIKSLLIVIEKHYTTAAIESTSAYELAHEYIDNLKGE